MRKTRAEHGQILPLVAIALVAMLGIAAFAIDVGFAYYAKRQLQSATDAAALAGAQDLPNATTAIATATTYATANTPSNQTSFKFTYAAKCTTLAVNAVGCVATTNPNELVVTGTASTNTSFAGLFGIKHFDVSAHANACSPCSSTPVDVVIVLDRTASMCIPTGSGQTCTDLNNAKSGIRTLLGVLNPPYAKVGMVAFPPVQTTTTDVCSDPYTSDPSGAPSIHDGINGDLLAYDGYDTATRGYLTDALTSNYKDSSGNLVKTSGLYLHSQAGDASTCVVPDGLTSYSEALRQGQAELVKDGRPNVPDFIVFLTDGEANIGSVYSKNDATFPQNGPDDQQPCQAGINAAKKIKDAGTTIYSIGYALGASTPCTHGTFMKVDNKGNWTVACTAGTTGCVHFASISALKESPTITSYTAVQTIASTPSTQFFFNQPTTGQLDTTFAAIATDIGAGSSRLVTDGF